MRLILDTNVVLSALLWRGPPFHLLHAIRQREDMRLFTSAALVTELADVLNRPFAAKRLALLDRTALELVAHYLVAADLVVPSTTPRVVMPDPDDDHVIAAWVARRPIFSSPAIAISWRSVSTKARALSHLRKRCG